MFEWDDFWKGCAQFIICAGILSFFVFLMVLGLGIGFETLNYLGINP